MFSVVGMLVVIGSVLGGFLMEKGKLPVLVQSAEFLTIAGAIAAFDQVEQDTIQMKG